MKRLFLVPGRLGWLGVWIALALVLAACSPAAAATAPGAPAVIYATATTAATAAAPATSTQAASSATPVASPQASIPNTGSAVVQAAVNPKFGQILVTSEGRTLYTNSVDSAGKIVCAESSCTNFWPPYIVAAQPAAVAGIPGSLGTVTRPDGKLQLTYNQKPLYTFYLDQAPGDAKGNGFVDLGGTWSVASLVSAPPVSSPVPPASPAPSNGSSGYKY